MAADSPSWPDGPVARGELVSFDGGTRLESSQVRPDKLSALLRPGAVGNAIPRGAGLSYTGASFHPEAVSIDLSLFDRILDFETATGDVRCEAGVSLAQLHAFLLARGRYLPVQPGHGRITIGGCIGADVHGKNQARDGTFIDQVRSLRLCHPDHGVLELAPDRDRDLFRLTCGGFGLTGVIVDAVLATKPVLGGSMRVLRQPVRVIEVCADILSAAAPSADTIYSWHDMANNLQGGGFVVSGVLEGDAAEAGEPVQPPPLSARARATGPGLLNPISARMMNLVYGAKAKTAATRESLTSALFPIHGSEVYFRLYGRAGFHEHQAVIPLAGFAAYVDAVRAAVRRHDVVLSLAATKYFDASAEPDLVRFTGRGVCIAFNTPRSARSPAFLEALDEAVGVAGGRVNLIKNSHTTCTTADRIFPQIDTMRDRLVAFDPKRRFRSELSERLGL